MCFLSLRLYFFFYVHESCLKILACSIHTSLTFFHFLHLTVLVHLSYVRALIFCLQFDSLVGDLTLCFLFDLLSFSFPEFQFDYFSAFLYLYWIPLPCPALFSSFHQVFICILFEFLQLFTCILWINSAFYSCLLSFSWSFLQACLWVLCQSFLSVHYP
jgi:hypothetical protein